MSNSLRPHGLYSPWNSPGQNTGVDSLSLLQGIFPTQELNQGLLHCRQIIYQLSYEGSPLKSRDITLLTKVRLVKAMAFSSSYVRMSDLDHKEGWAPKNWCFWTVVLQKILESPLYCKTKPVNPKRGEWKSLSCIQLFVTPWTRQSMTFSRPEYWSR